MVKKWFSETRRVDRDTGELLDKARTVRENWIRKDSSQEIRDCGGYLLKIITIEYEKNRQQQLEF